MAGAQYRLPDGLDLVKASTALAKHLEVERGPVGTADRTFYDTFDGRLHAEGLAVVHEDGRLAAVDATTYAERAGIDLAQRPDRVLPMELEDSPFRRLLEPIVEVRVLAPIARVSGRRRALRVLNGDAKTVVRLAVEAPVLVVPGRRRVPLRSRLHVTPVRGYDAELARVRETLEAELGLESAFAPLHDEAVTAAGGMPGGVPSKPAVDLRADQRTDAAAVMLLTALHGVIEANLPGALEDLDIEFLHDLRVAVRRSRSLQRQLKRAFPPEALARFRAQFKWIQQATGDARDLDVYVLEFDRFRDVVGPDLDPLRTALEARRAEAHRRMRRALRSARAKRLLKEWPAFLEELVEQPEDDRPHAAKPVAGVAGKRIRKVYGRMVAEGRAIDDDTPDEALHDLRKLGKELRYLLEFFSDLFPEEVGKPMVKSLKALQNTLGEFQDRAVQADMMRHLRDEVAPLEGGAAALMAMGLLVDRLDEEKTAARAEFSERFSAFAAKRQRKLVKDTF